MDGRSKYLRPSSAAIVMSCDGYPALMESVGAEVDEKDIDADNEVREDGTACHWLAEQPTGSVPEGHIAPNGRTITEEMLDACTLYHSIPVRRGIRPDQISIEMLVLVSVMFPGWCDGTPDRWYYCDIFNTLYVDDLKYGFRTVDAEWNLQLFLYALTIACVVLKISDPELTITLTIIQPRAYSASGPVREFSFKLHEAGKLVDDLRAAAARAMSPNPVCKTNPKCINCGARLRCPAFLEQGMAALEFSHAAKPQHMSSFELAYYLQQLEFAHDRLGSLITAMETEMEWQMRHAGGAFPGYAMRSKPGNRVWNCPPETVATLATLYGKDLIRAKPITPRQAGMAGIPESVVDMYSERRPSPAKLTRVDPNEAAKAFAKHKLNWTKENG